jgi:predicted amidophosphoribosyltransferase
MGERRDDDADAVGVAPTVAAPLGAGAGGKETAGTKPSVLAMTECPKCHAATPVARFCTGCGESLAPRRFCSECGARMKPGAPFCEGCGAKGA